MGWSRETGDPWKIRCGIEAWAPSAMPGGWEASGAAYPAHAYSITAWIP